MTTDQANENETDQLFHDPHITSQIRDALDRGLIYSESHHVSQSDTRQFCEMDQRGHRRQAQLGTGQKAVPDPLPGVANPLKLRLSKGFPCEPPMSSC
jgi:hypothetical protein